jgi:hypothetical protein
MSRERDELRETHDLMILEARLDELYATRLGRAEVRREVRAAYRCFDEAPIRSYVMILTERTARRRLAARADESTATAPRRRLQVAGVSA